MKNVKAKKGHKKYTFAEKCYIHSEHCRGYTVAQIAMSLGRSFDGINTVLSKICGNTNHVKGDETYERIRPNPIDLPLVDFLNSYAKKFIKRQRIEFKVAAKNIYKRLPVTQKLVEDYIKQIDNEQNKERLI